MTDIQEEVKKMMELAAAVQPTTNTTLLLAYLADKGLVTLNALTWIKEMQSGAEVFFKDSPPGAASTLMDSVDFKTFVQVTMSGMLCKKCSSPVSISEDHMTFTCAKCGVVGREDLTITAESVEAGVKSLIDKLVEEEKKKHDKASTGNELPKTPGDSA